MPVGVDARQIRAAGALKLQHVTGTRAGSPRPGRSFVAVHDEIDRQASRGFIPGAHGIRACPRMLIRRQRRSHLVVVGADYDSGAGRRQLELHVVIRERAGLEVGKIVADDAYPHHPRSQLLDRVYDRATKRATSWWHALQAIRPAAWALPQRLTDMLATGPEGGANDVANHAGAALCGGA